MNNKETVYLTAVEADVLRVFISRKILDDKQFVAVLESLIAKIIDPDFSIEGKDNAREA